MTTDEILDLSEAVAASYRRRCRWADWGDMLQTAAQAIIAAEPYFNPRVGLPKRPYVRRAAVLAVKRMLWYDSAPVHGRTVALRGLYRTPLTEHIHDAADVHAEACRNEWHARVRERLRAIVERDPEPAAGLAYLLEPRSSRRGRASYAPAYRAVTKLRRRVADDPALLSLWLES